MRRVLLLRHGQSTWNAERRWQGQADPPLSPLGTLQAAAAAEQVVGLARFTVVGASDLERARCTAETIAAALDVAPVRLDPRLRENHAGEWQGLTHAEIEAGWPGWIDAQRRPPGFERPEAVAERVGDAVRRLAEMVDDGAAAVAVTHGGSIRCLRRSIGNEDALLGNLAGAWFEVGHDGDITDGRMITLLDDALRSSTSMSPRATVE